MGEHLHEALIIDTWSSRCGKCGSTGQGTDATQCTVCDTVFTGVSTSYRNLESAVPKMRPDLVYVPFQRNDTDNE